MSSVFSTCWIVYEPSFEQVRKLSKLKTCLQKTQIDQQYISSLFVVHVTSVTCRNSVMFARVDIMTVSINYNFMTYGIISPFKNDFHYNILLTW